MTENSGEFQFDQNLAQVDDIFSLAKEGLFNHVIDADTQIQYLELLKPEYYPIVSGEQKLNKMLLKRDNANSELLVLPENFRTMAEALNDTIGNSPTRHSLKLAGKLFEKLGTDLSEVAKSDGVLPTKLSYKSIIVEIGEDESSIRFLPPLTLHKIDFDDENEVLDLRDILMNQLYHSCYIGASNKSQQQWLPSVFKSFVDNFDINN